MTNELLTNNDLWRMAHHLADLENQLSNDEGKRLLAHLTTLEAENARLKVIETAARALSAWLDERIAENDPPGAHEYLHGMHYAYKKVKRQIAALGESAPEYQSAPGNDTEGGESIKAEDTP